MKTTTSILLACLSVMILSGSCNYNAKNINGFTNKIGKSAMVDKYPRIPGEEILRQESGTKLYNELESRYRESLFNLQIETDRDGAKLVVVILTPDVGKNLSLANSYGIPYIVQSCNQLGIDCLDLSTVLATRDSTALMDGPSSGNWSKAASAFIADQLSYLLLSYDCYKNTKPFPQTRKPATFGDLKPGKDEMLESDKGAPLHITTNSQGLRMEGEVIFPKKKQRILFLGDAELLCPYLDNHCTSTYLLQQKYPGKEIINAGYMHYTMEDYLSLYLEKARYTEPDVVVVCTNGEDILDYFFSARNIYSRSQKVYKPSDNEKQFYGQMN